MLRERAGHFKRGLNYQHSASVDLAKVSASLSGFTGHARYDSFSTGVYGEWIPRPLSSGLRASKEMI